MGGAAHLISSAPLASVRMKTLGGVQPDAGAGGGVAVGGFGICDGPPVVIGGGAAGGRDICEGPPVPAGGAGMTGGGGIGELIDAVCVSYSVSEYSPLMPSHAPKLTAASATRPIILNFI